MASDLRMTTKSSEGSSVFKGCGFDDQSNRRRRVASLFLWNKNFFRRIIAIG